MSQYIVTVNLKKGARAALANPRGSLPVKHPHNHLPVLPVKSGNSFAGKCSIGATDCQNILDFRVPLAILEQRPVSPKFN